MLAIVAENVPVILSPQSASECAEAHCACKCAVKLAERAAVFARLPAKRAPAIGCRMTGEAQPKQSAPTPYL